MANIIAFQGAGANCGKTTTMVGLLRAISEKGISVAPYKAVSVLSQKSFGYLNSVEQLCEAAKIPFSSIYNPITIEPFGKNSGRLLLHNSYICDVKLGATDTPLFDSLEDSIMDMLKSEVHQNLSKLKTEFNYDLILNEGASNPLDLFLYNELDLSNIEIIKSTNSPIILVIRAYDGGHWASLMGTIMGYPPEYRHLIKGVIINDALNVKNTIFQEQLNSFCDQFNVNCYGVIPRVDYFDGVIESSPQDFEEEYKIWAKVANEYLNIDDLIKLKSESD